LQGRFSSNAQTVVFTKVKSSMTWREQGRKFDEKKGMLGRGETAGNSAKKQVRGVVKKQRERGGTFP